MERFCEEFGALECNALTRLDMRDPEARRAGTEAGVFGTVCPGLVKRATELVEELIDC